MWLIEYLVASVIVIVAICRFMRVSTKKGNEYEKKLSENSDLQGMQGIREDH